MGETPALRDSLPAGTTPLLNPIPGTETIGGNRVLQIVVMSLDHPKKAVAHPMAIRPLAALPLLPMTMKIGAMTTSGSKIGGSAELPLCKRC